jgi:hypothetical protein
MGAAAVTLKLHRFEIGAAVLGTLAIAAWAASVRLRLGSFGSSRECLEQWARDSGSMDIGCPTAFGSWTDLVSEATRIIGATAYLPFVVGVLVGTPLVARELEARTAQTAWSLTASRVRWLAGRLAPVLVVVGLAVALAAITTAGVQADREVFGEPAFYNLGNSGFLVAARTFGAFGIGLAVGAAVGRTLPAVAVSAIFIIAISTGLSSTRDGWLASFEPQPAQHSESGQTGMVITDVAWQAPDGTILSKGQARERATAAGVPPADPDDVQDLPALAWYEQNGFTEVPLGVSEQAALGWATYDAATWIAAGAIALIVTVGTISRRRVS